MLLGMVLAVMALCSWAAQDGKTLKMKLDLVDFGDSVVVYCIGQKEQTFTGKNGKFEFELQVDLWAAKPCACGIPTRPATI